MTVKYISFSRRRIPALIGIKVIIAALILLIVGCGDNHASNSGNVTAAAAAAGDGQKTDINGPTVYEPPADSRNAGEKPAEIPAPGGQRIGGDLGMTRAMAAKMLALALYSENTIDSMEREIGFIDTDKSKWYDKYINAVFVQGCMSGDGKTFAPNAPFTFDQVRVVLNRLDPGHIVKIQDKGADGSKAVSYELWIDIYLKLLKFLNAGGIESKDFVVLGAAGNNSLLNNWHMITDTGMYRHAGLNVDNFIDQRIQALVKDGEIVGLLSVTDTKPTIYNAYIVDCGAQSITIFSGGAERAYGFANALTGVKGDICDIHIDNGKALGVVVKPDNIGGTIMRANDTEIEIDGKTYKRDGHFKVYSIADGPVKWKDIKDLYVGTDIAVFTIDNNRVCAGIITKTAVVSNIRVALQTTGYKGFIHEGVKGTSDSDYTAIYGTQTQHFKAGEVFNADNFPKGNRIFIKPDNPDGTVRITTIKRSWPDGLSPSYPGIIEIGMEEGGYSIVNELPLEQYLYAVVPSEMPASYGLEAAKTQAVTARSYAYNQFFENRFYEYGANVDDSVSCQVYNNLPAGDISRQAVDQTRGMVARYAGSVINANFFSTSCGMTANSGEVWTSAGKEFPSASSPYLISTREYTGKDYGDLSVEKNAEQFLKSMSVAGYDSDASWFRWNVAMSAAELSASININLKARYEAAPALIKTLIDGKNFRSRPIESIGYLQDLEVTRRGEGGNVMEMKITGTNAVIMVETEYNIRCLLQPQKNLANGGDITITRKDGSKVVNMNMLPSAFFVMDKAMGRDGVDKVTFYGGGYGHGVGLSQNGVKGMIDKGFNFSQIIAHYYPGTEIKKMW